MIKLEEFVIEIDGNKYIPFEIAQHAQTEGAVSYTHLRAHET